MASVSTAYVQSVLSYLTDLGITPPAMACDENSGRIAMEHYIDLLSLGETLSGQSLFGFELGKRIQAKDYGVLGYLVESCENLSQAIDALIRFDSLVADIGDTHVYPLEYQVQLDWIPKSTNCKHMVLRNTTAWIATVRKILGEMYKPDEITFAFDLTSDELAILSDWFNCKVIIRATTNSIIFSKELLSIPFTSENKAMFRALIEVSESELQARNTHSNIKEQVTLLLKAKASLRQCDQTRIAAALFISPRTLQRKLKQQGTSFIELLTFERQSRVDFLLTQYSIAETAFELGFQEQSSFTHAFKKWRGITPLKHQQMLR
ncbi:AraC family transcriptional regulator [Pseudoalteromonas sp. G4]|uniref:AraC family transcriptional regulator n=1 Tax=Pseudoalteromonas sp. G4 TaxID=2992761 RepID=UPI00237E3507|nr:AraC family transcriptional regulator [Pseudoalteromonas sp. G4]MDE3270942.1 AraC family transcriptional regulator [Pseudoalteromonas sp. G4]